MSIYESMSRSVVIMQSIDYIRLLSDTNTVQVLLIMGISEDISTESFGHWHSHITTIEKVNEPLRFYILHPTHSLCLYHVY